MIQLYTLLDKASKTTNHPMAFQSQRDALDGLRQVALDEKTALAKHPEDFELYQLADYNPRTMEMETFDPPIKIASVKEILN